MRIAVPMAIVLALLLAACGGGGNGGGGAAGGQDSTSGASFEQPGKVEDVSFDESGAATENDGSIDTSKVNDGIVT